jgi:hypothetical protein
MQILIDKNNLLVIENPNIPKLKEYDLVASGYRFGDYDKWIVVYHKKQIKIINLKNLGENMNVFFVIKRDKSPEIELDKDLFGSALWLFAGFDENTGNKYFFIPKMKDGEVEIVNKKLEILAIGLKLIKSEKGIIVDKMKSNKGIIPNINNAAWKNSIISFLFGLILIYGKMEIKNNELIGLKIHLPLFGQYIKYKEELDTMIKNLQEEWIFLNTSIVKNNDGIIYQLSSSDYELLWYFANWYQSIEKIDKILKQEITNKVKLDLINFVEMNEQVPYNGKEQVLEMIEDGIIKLLVVW